VLTPLDGRNKEFNRSVRGYSIREVDQFLEELVHDYETLYLENQLLKEKLEASEAAKIRYQDMEAAIKDAIIVAQKNGEDMKNKAQNEADAVLKEARAQAGKIVSEAGEKATRIKDETREQLRVQVAETEERIKATLEKYRSLETQAQVFRHKFQAFLEAQMKLMGNHDEEARAAMVGAGLGVTQAAASLVDEAEQPDGQPLQAAQPDRAPEKPENSGA